MCDVEKSQGKPMWPCLPSPLWSPGSLPSQTGAPIKLSVQGLSWAGGVSEAWLVGLQENTFQGKLPRRSPGHVTRRAESVSPARHLGLGHGMNVRGGPEPAAPWARADKDPTPQAPPVSPSLCGVLCSGCQ